MTIPAVDMVLRRATERPAVFRRYRSAIDGALRDEMSGDRLSAYQMLRYSMGWTDVGGKPWAGTQGKALRPTLCLFACEAIGSPTSKALPAAVSLELVHSFSLIHDDIQDQDETRHHRPTLWAVWGKPKALIAGNTLRVIADKSLWSLVDAGASFEEALRATNLLTAAYLEMIEGQYLDLAFEGRPDVGMSEYLDMISRKTGALIRCALNVGALLGARDGAAVGAFRECGSSLGLVFQIRDDVLGTWGDEDATGKPVGADIRRKKNTLPAVYAMSQARGRDRELLLTTYRGNNIGDREVARVLDVMDRVGAKDYAQSLAAEHCELALESLSQVELASEARQDMVEIAHFLLEREH